MKPPNFSQACMQTNTICSFMLTKNNNALHDSMQQMLFTNLSLANTCIRDEATLTSKTSEEPSLCQSAYATRNDLFKMSTLIDHGSAFGGV